jgi:hypothetical protein
MVSAENVRFLTAVRLMKPSADKRKFGAQV